MRSSVLIKEMASEIIDNAVSRAVEAERAFESARSAQGTQTPDSAETFSAKHRSNTMTIAVGATHWSVDKHGEHSASEG
jgi:hypothetical protein